MGSISISQLCKDCGVNVLLDSEGAVIKKGDKIVGKGYINGGLYVMSFSEDPACLFNMHRDETKDLVTDSLNEDNNPCARAWYLDSKTNLHMCNSRKMFVDYRPVSDEEVNIGENGCVKVAGIGTVKVRFTTGKVLTLSNVCHTPKLNKCVLSVSELDGNGFSVVFGGGEVVIKKSDVILGKGYKEGGLYRLSIIEGPDTKSEVKRGVWCLSSRATAHVCNSRDMLTNYKPLTGHEVIFANNEHVEVAGDRLLRLSLVDKRQGGDSDV